ncbi:unnamed protein product [Rotaria sp. Silwood2]|nr:unnamed protein product [Rotaria sp. Silwood2]CAF2836089.1 unnamed protein product [Rotaria sp. Silwood2]CAF3205080.1 unnamed protein product [Rotaria sp. Silwood2]
MATFRDLYSNIFTYPLYIGICLLLMIVYSIIYMVLAVYIERINPGQFGISQPFYYPCFRKTKKTSSTVPISYYEENGWSSMNKTNTKIHEHNHWIEMDSNMNKVCPLMRIKHLTKKFGKLTAVSDFSFDFYKGEVCALLGHNGAGKTTITFILVGMLEATSGCVILQDLDHRIHIQQTRKMIGFCPQYDPYNRRLIWTIIQKMKDAGKCVILTTHFLEEADILSDRIAIMSHGQLQASGTPDFLKKQTEYEYRLFIDKQDVCNTESVAQFIQQHVQTVVLERETSSELVFGIKRGATQNIGRLIRGLDEQCQQLAINGYGLSMTTIEEVFLRFIITDVP